MMTNEDVAGIRARHAHSVHLKGRTPTLDDLAALLAHTEAQARELADEIRGHEDRAEQLEAMRRERDALQAERDALTQALGEAQRAHPTVECDRCGNHACACDECAMDGAICYTHGGPRGSECRGIYRRAQPPAQGAASEEPGRQCFCITAKGAKCVHERE